MRAALLVPLFLSMAAPLHADDANDARDLFERARTLRAANDCEHAVPLFKKAYELFPSGLGSLRNWAECEEQLAHFASSRRAWLELKRALIVERSAKYVGWDRDAEEASARLAPKVARLTIHVSGAPPTELVVSLNQEHIASTLLDTALERDAGHYIVEVRTSAGTKTSREVELVTGGAQKVTLTVTMPVAVTPPVASPIVKPPEESHADPKRTLGWIGVALGGASLVGAAISLGVRQSALASLASACPDYSTGPCPASVEPTVSEGKTASMLVNAFTIGGAVLGVAGVVLVLTSPAHRTRAAVALTGRGVTMEWPWP
jgi:hypothetical protein